MPGEHTLGAPGLVLNNVSRNRDARAARWTTRQGLRPQVGRGDRRQSSRCSEEGPGGAACAAEPQSAAHTLVAAPQKREPRSHPCSPCAGGSAGAVGGEPSLQTETSGPGMEAEKEGLELPPRSS